jgi:hypothetical protein
MRGRWPESLGILAWASLLAMFTLPKMLSWPPWTGWVGTILGTVKDKRLGTQATEGC